MFFKNHLAVVDYLPKSEFGGYWRYVINIIQHEKAEIPIRTEMGHWLHRFVYATDYSRLFCATKTIQLVG
jgi:hypothetical protein